jgi:hypothetical protein
MGDAFKEDMDSVGKGGREHVIVRGGIYLWKVNGVVVGMESIARVTQQYAAKGAVWYVEWIGERSRIKPERHPLRFLSLLPHLCRAKVREDGNDNK